MEKSTSLARNRDNQRRARERRQKYIQELEQRSREYEIAGVQATVEVQAAAKKVVDENTRLRSLLDAVGVTNDQINDYLQHGTLPFSRHAHSHSNPPTMQQMTRQIKLEETQMRTPPGSSNSDSGAPQTFINYDIKRNLPTQPQKQQRCGTSKSSKAQAKCSSGTKCSPATATVLPTPTSTTDEKLLSNYSDETSCIDAAHIIASMRGLPDSRDVFTELGCSEGQLCRVKNSTVFQIMDR